MSVNIRIKIQEPTTNTDLYPLERLDRWINRHESVHRTAIAFSFTSPACYL